MYTALAQPADSSNSSAVGDPSPQVEDSRVFPFVKKAQKTKSKEPGESTGKSLQGFTIPKSKEMPVVKPQQVPAIPRGCRKQRRDPCFISSAK